MTALWRRTSELFWQFGVLWVPMLVADMVSFAVLSSRKPLIHVITTSMLQKHSVLTDTVPEFSTGHTALLKVEILAGAVSVTSLYLSVFVYLAALLVTAEIVRRKLGEDRVYGNERPFKKLAVLSAGVSAITLFVGICVGLGTIRLLQVVHRDTWLVSPYFGQVVAFIMLTVMAFVVTPMALRAIRGSENVVINARTKQLGRQSAALAVGVSNLVLAFVTMAQNSLLATQGQWLIVNIVASLMTTMPYIPLALLANEDRIVAPSGSDE